MGSRVVGTPGAEGVAVGLVWRYTATERRETPGAVPTDAVAAIRAAAAEAVRQLGSLAERMRGLGRADEAGIFDAQAMMATDPQLLDEAVARAEAGQDPEAAVGAAAEVVVPAHPASRMARIRMREQNNFFIIKSWMTSIFSDALRRAIDTYHDRMH